MTDIDQLKGSPFEPVPAKKGIPGTLNVLTILTFIGCGLGLIFTIYQQVTAKTTLETMEKMQGTEAVEKMPEFAKKMYSPENMEMMRISYENRIPLMIITLVSLVLCLFGAIQMRQLKKQGYFLWLIGEILPFVGSVLFVGMNSLTGFAGMVGLTIVAIFVILYSFQLKHLK
ncbi:MAG: hypothetical protein ABIN89_10880 [Chitinophagaceae bacterium]